MKRLLMVGAGVAQLDGIRRARDLGMDVIAVDGDPNAPGLALANNPIVADITDEEQVVALARKHDVDGVMCISVDIAVRAVAAAAAELGLPGPTPAAAFNATSKHRMRELWEQAGVPSCLYRPCRTVVEAHAAAGEIGFPVVVKPSDNAGSRGVTWVENAGSMEAAYAHAMSYSRGGTVLVEEFMLGVEMSVEGIVYNGTLHVTGTSDKKRTQPPHLLDLEVLFPSEQPRHIREGAIGVVADAVRALGLDMTPVHAEVMVTSEGPRMVEIAARGPGFKVFSTMIPWTRGVDVIRESIRMAVGQVPRLKPSGERGAVLVFPKVLPGRLMSLEGLEAARSIPNICEVELYVNAGDIIKPLRCGSDRIGHIIALAETRPEAEGSVRRAERLLRLQIQPAS